MKKVFLFYLLLFVKPCLSGECDFIQLNVCRSCDNPQAFPVGSQETCSFLCPERIVNFKGSGASVRQINCAVSECPAELPFQSDYGNCYKTQTEAKNDSGLFTKSEYDEKDILKSSTKEKNCPQNHFKRWDGKCFPCDYPKAVRVETHCNLEQDCDDICPNRTIIKWAGGNVPSVLNCPLDKPMMDDEGICYSCDTPVPIGVQWNPDFCRRFCPNERHLEGVFCVLNLT